MGIPAWGMINYDDTDGRYGEILWAARTGSCHRLPKIPAPKMGKI